MHDIDIHKAVLRADMERINHTLRGKPVKVEFENSPYQDPAWSVNGRVYLNLAHLDIPLTSKTTLIRAFGLNYHELCHLLWSGPAYHNARGVAYTTLHGINSTHFVSRVANILEDQRIETLFLKKYASVKPYFVSIVGRHILDGEDHGMAYLLIAGRDYLGADVQRKFRAKYNDPATVGDMERIVRTYVALGETADVKALAQPIVDLCKLLMATLPDTTMPNSPSHNVEGDDVTVPDSGDSATSSSDGDEDGEEDGEENGEENGDEDGGENSEENGEENGEENAVGSGGSSAGSTKAEEDDDRDASDTMLDAVSEAENDHGLTKEVQDRQRTLINKRTLSRSDFDNVPKRPYMQDALLEDVMTVRRTAVEFARLRADEDPGWDLGVNSGRLNVQRSVTSKDFDPDTAFDRWEPGQQDSSDMEVVILLDLSGSMIGDKARMSQRAMWIIRRALQQATNSTVSAYGFGGNVTFLFGRNHKPSPTSVETYSAYSGSTYGQEAVDRAALLFATSAHEKKVLIVIGDGRFSDGMGVSESVHALAAAGVETSLVYITAWYENADDETLDLFRKQGFGTVTHAKTIGSLTDFARSVIRRVIKSHR